MLELTDPNTSSVAVGPPVSVRVIERSFEAWDAYVSQHPHGSPFHLNAWKRSIEDTFGFEPIYLAAERNGTITGILPLFLVKNLLVRKALISTPFAVYGGALADDPETYAAISEHVRALANRMGVQYVELRNGHSEQSLGFSPVSRYVTFTHSIGPEEETILDSIPRKTRRMVRKSLAEGYSVHIETEKSEAFEDIYSKSLQRLGTPAFPKRHYENLLEHFRGSIDIREFRLNGNLASAVMSFYFRDQVLPYYGASDPAFNGHAPNNFMYYDLMCWSGRNGYRIFDFGRSRKQGSGSYDFKAHWGMVERELPYEMLLVKRKELPNFSPANPIFKLPMWLWRRTPLGITRRLGPVLIRLVP